MAKFVKDARAEVKDLVDEKLSKRTSHKRSIFIVDFLEYCHEPS